MRILFALPYGPTVTRVRPRRLLEELAVEHDITLVGLVWGQADSDALDAWRDRGHDVYGVPHPLTTRVRAMTRDFGRPLQERVARTPHYAALVRALIERERRRGQPFDAVHVEHLRGASAVDLFDPLPLPVVWDSVDCLAELARLTAKHGPNALVRSVAALEERRTREVERELLWRVDAASVVAERDRLALLADAPGDHLYVIPNGAPVRESPVMPTDRPVACFTGKLSYHANQAAVRLLVEQIWPAVYRQMPDAELIIAGADPPRWMRRIRAPGVRLRANPEHIETVIEGSRVALAPVVYSVGIQNKLLEAWGAGIPVVATSPAAEGLPAAGRALLDPAPSVSDFVQQTLRYLGDQVYSRRMGASGYEYVQRHHSWTAAAAQFTDLYYRVSSRRRAA